MQQKSNDFVKIVHVCERCRKNGVACLTPQDRCHFKKSKKP